MAGNGDIGERASEIGQLIANAEPDRAFVRGIDFANDFTVDNSFRREALILSGRHKQTARDYRRKEIGRDEFTQQHSKNQHDLLALIDDIVDTAAELGDAA